MKPPDRTIFALASILLLAVLLSGCGLPWPFPQPTPDPKLPDAQQILRPLASGPNAGDLDTLDPGRIQFGFDYGMAQLIFPQLVTLDERQLPIDWAAKSHEISSDGLTYTFHLNPGMKWSDGTAIDANTFAYSINRSLDPCFASGVSYYNLNIKGATDYNAKTCDADTTSTDAYKGLDKTAKTALIGKSIVASDPLTLAVTIESPAAYFLSEVSYPTFWGVPQQLIAKYDQTKWTDHMADGSGLGGNFYKLTRWDKAGHLEFTANDSFWGKPAIIQHVNYTLYPNTSIAWTDFIHGVGDSAIPPIDFSASDGGIGAARALPRVILQRVPSLAFRFLAINWQVAPFDDVRVRQAFSLALDRQAIAHEAFLGTSQPTIHLVPEGMQGYNPDLTDAAGRKGKDALTPDLPAARALLGDYVTAKCGGSAIRCPTVVLFGPEGSASTTRLLQELGTQWRRAFPGYPILAQPLSGSVCLPCFSHLATLTDGWGAAYADPHEILSRLWTTGSEVTISHASVPQVDLLLAQADGMSDQAARTRLYQQTEQLLTNQGVTIPLTQPLYWHAVRARVVSWRVAPTGVTPLAVWQTAHIKR